MAKLRQCIGILIHQNHPIAQDEESMQNGEISPIESSALLNPCVISQQFEDAR